ncbi:MAG TPA: hypothetical protein VN428_16840 [Bryobacteraceae bacterium]|nr:hypothetical protein [Bryobacteraceae bacterium]
MVLDLVVEARIDAGVKRGEVTCGPHVAPRLLVGAPDVAVRSVNGRYDIAETRKLVVERAKTVLLAAAGRQDLEIAAELRTSSQKAARWRKRFLR